MAVSRKTQKDVGNYEPKLIGPFTTRQTIFIGIGAVIDVLLGVTLEAIGVDFMTIAALCIVIIIPFVLLGYLHPYGMKAEQFLIQYYIYHIAAPGVRKYETKTGLDNMKYKTLQDELDAEKSSKKTSKKSAKTTHKKDPEYPDFL